jgi:hypothetical protein
MVVDRALADAEIGGDVLAGVTGEDQAKRIGATKLPPDFTGCDDGKYEIKGAVRGHVHAAHQLRTISTIAQWEEAGPWELPSVDKHKILRRPDV